MAKITQCMKINVLNTSFCCTFDPERKHNSFRLYKTWNNNGKHRKLIAEYANFESVLHHLIQLNCSDFQRDCFFKEVL